MYKFLFILFFIPTLIVAETTPDTLEVSVYNSPPFGMKRESGAFGGLMVELWESIAKELNVPYRYTLTDMDELMSGLQNGRYDVGLGAISITPKREKLVDFTHAVNPSGTGIAISKKSMSTSFTAKWSPILTDLLELIGILVLMLFVSALIVYFIEKKYAKGERTERHIESISDGIWWAAVTMTTVGYGDKVPKSRIGKLLGIFWIFISIIFFSLFTANASAKLVTYEVESRVNTLDDLRKVRVVAVSKSSGEEFLIREGISYSKIDNLEEAIQTVIDGNADAIVSNIPVLKYQNKVNFKDQLIISNHFLLRNNMGIALQEKSELKESINYFLLQKISEPKWQYDVYKYIGD